MRGVRAWWKAPLAFIVVLLAACNFDFNLVNPAIEISAQTAYQSGNKFILDYRFIADESTLRCKYSVHYSNALLKQDVTGTFVPNTWQHLEIKLTDDADPPPPSGEYAVQLMAQAQRGDGFVDLAFLTKTYGFYFDTDAPSAPQFSPEGRLFSDTAVIELSHPEWDPEWEGPPGSPVHIYYTVNDPNPINPEPSNEYVSGTAIRIDPLDIPTEIRAIAIDESGRQSAIALQVYRFMNIEHMHSTTAIGALNEFDTRITTEPQSVYLHGYGLENVLSAGFTDANGTSAATVAVMDKNAEQVILSIFLPSSGFAGDGTNTDGTITLFDTSGISDDIKINLWPEP